MICECGHEFDPVTAEPLRHRLSVGDSTDARQINCLTGGRVQLIVTSPPYNCSIEYDLHADDMETEHYLGMVRAVVNSVAAVLDDGCFVCWNVGVGLKSHHIEHANIIRDAGLSYYRQIVWAKAGVPFPVWQNTIESGLARKYHPNYTHEVLYLFSKGPPATGGPADIDDTYSCDVWHIQQSAATSELPGKTNGRRPRNERHGGSKSAVHPAAFAVGIPLGAIKHLTARGEAVLDPFGWSGTTIRASEMVGRTGLAMEISPAYAAVSLQRMTDVGCEASLID